MLSDADKRAVYDEYGEEGLRGEVPQAGRGGGTDDIFAEFFGSTPFTYCNTATGGGGGGNARAGSRQPPPPPAWDSGFGHSYRRNNGGATSTMAPPPPPVESRLACTLEELYMGVTKKMRISRNVVDAIG